MNHIGIEDDNRYNLILALESDPEHKTWRVTQAVRTQILGSEPVSVILLSIHPPTRHRN